MKPKVLILPTGNEIREGIVLDTDSPMIRDTLLAVRPGCDVTISEPIPDDEDMIVGHVYENAHNDFSLIVFIGGSGGGHRHSASLAGDYTHSALDRLLSPKSGTSLYGWNGHLWSRLVCGYAGNTLVINLPGPFQEAKAAIEAFAALWKPEEPDVDLQEMNDAMATAVSSEYQMRSPCYNHHYPVDQT